MWARGCLPLPGFEEVEISVLWRDKPTAPMQALLAAAREFVAERGPESRAVPAADPKPRGGNSRPADQARLAAARVHPCAGAEFASSVRP